MDIDKPSASLPKITIRSVHPIPHWRHLDILFGWHENHLGMHMAYGFLARSAEKGGLGAWHMHSTETLEHLDDEKNGINHFSDPPEGPAEFRVLQTTPAVFSKNNKAIVCSAIAMDGRPLSESKCTGVNSYHFREHTEDSSCVKLIENRIDPHIDCESAAGLYHTVIIAADNEGEPHMLFRVAVPIPLANGENAGKPTPQAMDYIYRHCNSFIDECKQQNPDWPEGICDKKHSGCLIAP